MVSGKCWPGTVPDPFGSIPITTFFFGTSPAPLSGFHIDAFGKRIGGYNGSAAVYSDGLLSNDEGEVVRFLPPALK